MNSTHSGSQPLANCEPTAAQNPFWSGEESDQNGAEIVKLSKQDCLSLVYNITSCILIFNLDTSTIFYIKNCIFYQKTILA